MHQPVLLLFKLLLLVWSLQIGLFKLFKKLLLLLPLLREFVRLGLVSFSAAAA